MLPLLYIHCGILIGAGILYYGKRSLFLRFEKQILAYSILLNITALAYLMHREFTGIIESPPPIRYYAPPFTPLSSFFLSFFTRIAGPALVSLSISLTGYLLIAPIQRIADRLAAGERTLIALTILCLPQPLWIVLPAIVTLMYLCYATVRTLRYGTTVRTSFAALWIPAGLTILACTSLLLRLPLLQSLSFNQAS